MFSRRNNEETTAVTSTTTTTPDVLPARGGISWWAVLTGVVVAFGTFFLLSAIVGSVIATTGLENEVESATAVEVGIGAGIAIIVAQFLSYLWGGYTAGRMSRGLGAVNGLLVPVIAIAIAAAVLGIASALGETANLSLPFNENRLPLQDDYTVEFGVGVGVGILVAMLLGGLLGGSLGSRWHTKLERRTLEEESDRRSTIVADRTGLPDRRETTTTTTPPPPPATMQGPPAGGPETVPGRTTTTPNETATHSSSTNSSSDSDWSTRRS